jgi:hypothetical protein
VTLGLGVCSAVAARSQPMEKQHANVHRRAPMSGLDNSLSTHGPEKPRSTEKTGALSALKASFGIKDTNSPPRLQQTTSPAQNRRAVSFGNSQPQPTPAAEVSSDNWEHGKLYEAYNELHALAQAFSKPFDAPAILVVGHQTDGKSGTRTPAQSTARYTSCRLYPLHQRGNV